MTHDNESLTFEHTGGIPPTRYAAIIRDDNDVLITAKRSRNADGEWEVRGYRVYGEHVFFKGLNAERGDLAAIFIEQFDTKRLATREKYARRTPVRKGVPAVVAADGKPAVAAWLLVAGRDRDDLAGLLGVGDRTVTEYLSRFRRRGDGIPDGIDPPPVGSILPELPPEMDGTQTDTAEHTA